MRGEYNLHWVHQDELTGSTPHAWGIPKTVRWPNTCLGINPTCVGNTRKLSWELKADEDQPHMRGEY